MGIIKGFTFDGIRSKDFYIGLTGKAVYDAPERDVEMIEIAGRDGEFALDNGRFRNIDIPYPASTFGSDQPDFSEKMSAFRNAIASRKGYKRLEDEYNPDEYRMAVYKAGLAVDPIANGKAGEFEITFNCKPQRFLKSGETEQDLTAWRIANVRSGGYAELDGRDVKSAVSDVAYMASGRTYINMFQSNKNILRRMPRTEPYEHNGVTFTYLDDGGIRVTGNSGGTTAFINIGNAYTFPDNCVLSGCPVGGSAETFELRASYYSGTTEIKRFSDYGNGVVIDEGVASILIYINTNSQNVDMVFYPMVRFIGTTPDFEIFEGVIQTINFGRTVYGGTYDYISGVLTSTLESDGTELATPETYQLTARSLTGEYEYLWSSGGDIVVESGDAPNRIYNPTYFDAHPLLMVNGYGTININGELVVVDPSQAIGDLVLAPQIQGIRQTFDTSALNEDDTITVKSFVANLFVYPNDPNYPIINIGVSSGDGEGTIMDDGGAVFTIERENQTFVMGTSATKNFSLTITVTTDSTSLTGKIIQASLTYDGANTIALTFDKVSWGGNFYTVNSNQRPDAQTIGEVDGTSTKQTAGDPAYIDLEIGEAYKTDNGSYISLNKSTSIPAELPSLKSGENEITHDNTVTALKIIPRWWKI